MEIKNVVWIEKLKDDKKKYHNVGALFIKDDDKMSIKLSTIPVNFDGWLQVFSQKKKDDDNTNEPY